MLEWLGRDVHTHQTWVPAASMLVPVSPCTCGTCPSHLRVVVQSQHIKGAQHTCAHRHHACRRSPTHMQGTKSSTTHQSQTVLQEHMCHD